IAVMGPEAAVNAVYANKIAELPESERAAFIEEKREEYRQDIDIYRLASELVVDGIIPANSLRDELIKRFEAYSSKYLVFSERKHPVYPV
ncbi:carboxyl transferase domain-containing protein, partial [Effusibacillus lacus]